MLPYKCTFVTRTLGRCVRPREIRLLGLVDPNSSRINIRPCTTNSVSNTDSTEVGDAVNDIGRFYNTILFAGRKGIPLGLNRLRKLLEMVNEPAHGKFAVLGINYYHYKGMDFNFEINQKFISACLKSKNINGLLDVFLKYNYRLAAWTTGNNFHLIVTEFHTNPVTITSEQLIKLFDIITVKGVQVQEHTLDVVLQIISSKNDLNEEVRNNIVTYAKRILKSDVVDSLVSKYPTQAAKAATPASETTSVVTQPTPSDKK